MNNIALFIASEKGWSALKKVIDKGFSQNIKLVITFKEVDVYKSYDEDIMSLCKENSIRCNYWAEIKDTIMQILNELKIDIAFTISWKYLIDTEINKILKHGLIIFHDSLLPKYRGFAPTPTAIMCGDNKVGVTAILASDKVDEGDIVLQKEIYVDKDDYISDIIKKEAKVCGDMLIEVIEMAQTNAITLKKQDNSAATYSIWRDVSDCKIDWNKSSFDIRNFIRAVSTPYPGAYFFYNNKKVIVHEAEIVDDLIFAIRHPGKIWQISDNCPIVICKTGMLKITNAKYCDGSKVIFNRLRINLSGGDTK